MRDKAFKTLILLLVSGTLLFYYEVQKAINVGHGYSAVLKPRSKTQDVDKFDHGLSQRELAAYDIRDLVKNNDVIKDSVILQDRRTEIISDECRIVLNGETDKIKRWRNSSDQSFPWRDVKTDDDVISMAGNCTRLKNSYKFPESEVIVTDEELQFPIAYSILAHENVNQILVLLSAIYREHNIHCIHLDAKASPKVHEALVQAVKCFPNVFISTVRSRVVYAHVSRLLADIACMKDLVTMPKTVYNWKYLINLCSQDFPLRTNKEIVRQLKEFKGYNSIGGYREINDLIKERTEFVYRIKNVTDKNGVTQEKVVKTKVRHSPPPFNMTMMKNLAYNFYTREFLQWALVDSEVGKALLNWSMDTYSPDEHIWLMLHSYPGAPGGSQLASGYQLARQIKWWFTNDEGSCHGAWRHYICIYGAEEIHELTKTRNVFVNKIDVTLDSSGTKCLRQWLDERSLLPSDLRRDTNPDIKPDRPPDSFFV